MTEIRRDLVLATIVFVAAWSVYHASHSHAFESQDTIPNAFLPLSVLTYGDFTFSSLQAPIMFIWSAKTGHGNTQTLSISRWSELIPGVGVPAWRYHEAGLLEMQSPRYFLLPTSRRRAGTDQALFVGAFGPGPGLTALPIAAAAWWLGWPALNDPYVTVQVATITAELLVAASVAMVFLTAIAFTTRRRAFVLAAAYGLGTCVWTLSAQGLWQQTPELFFLSLGILCVLRGDNAWVRGVVAGLAFSAAAACRPTAAVVAIAALTFLLLSDRRAALAFVFSTLPAAIGVLAYNNYYLGSPFDFGQLAAGAAIATQKTGSPDLWQTPVWQGAAGLLFSPSRGLLVYSPFLAAAFAGGLLAWRHHKYTALRFLTVAVPLLWIPAFMWFDWWGGWTYGYRPIVDSVPLLAVLCIPAIDGLCTRSAWRYAYAAAIGWSVFVQVLGLLAYTPSGWNARKPGVNSVMEDIDRPEYRARLWYWSDWQIGYLIARLPQVVDGER